MALPDPPLYPDLKGKVVLILVCLIGRTDSPVVTGIGQQGDPEMWGNGAATASVFVQQGCKVVGCDINLPSAEHTKRRIDAEGYPGEITVLEADMTKSDDVKSLVDAVMQKYSRIDVLVNNVGVSQPGTPATMTETTWDAQIAVNLKSAYLTTHHILPIMESQTPCPASTTDCGAIINTSSIAALRYLSKPQIAYSTAKAGLIAFTRTTAAMYAAQNIRVNCVVPGLMHTPLIGSLADKYEGGDLEALVRKREGSVPMGRMGSGFDVAYATCFLASAAARYVTGQKLVVDGGVVGSAAPG